MPKNSKNCTSPKKIPPSGGKKDIREEKNIKSASHRGVQKNHGQGGVNPLSCWRDMFAINTL